MRFVTKNFSLLLILLSGCTEKVYVKEYVQVPIAPLVYPAGYYNKVYPRVDMPSCESINAKIKAGIINPSENLQCMNDKTYINLAEKIKAQKAVIEQCEQKINSTSK